MGRRAADSRRGVRSKEIQEMKYIKLLWDVIAALVTFTGLVMLFGVKGTRRFLDDIIAIQNKEIERLKLRGNK